MLAELRGDPTTRPTPSGEVIQSARSHLEAAAAAWVEAIPAGVSVRVTKDAVANVRRCEARHLAELAARGASSGASPGAVVPALVRGRLLDSLFRQVATTGTVGPDPMAEAFSASAAENDDTASLFLALNEAERQLVRTEVEAASAQLVADWPTFPPGAGLRTQERLFVELAGGRVVLSGRPDLAIGRPTRMRAGVLIVEAKSGAFSPAHLDEVRFYALLEALRWGVPPFRAVVWCLGTGRRHPIDVDADLIWSEALRVADAITRLTRLAAGEAPRTSANPLCSSCPRRNLCPDGTRQIALTDGLADPEFDTEFDTELDEDDDGDGQPQAAAS